MSEDPDSASKRFPLATNGVFAGVDISMVHGLTDLDVVLYEKPETEANIAHRMKLDTKKHWKNLIEMKGDDNLTIIGS